MRWRETKKIKVYDLLGNVRSSEFEVIVCISLKLLLRWAMWNARRIPLAR